MSQDPFQQFKAMQREGWALFSPLAMYTTPPAAALVEFAGVAAGERVLDVGCGTGVVAITAARRGARVSGLDLSPVLLADARQNAELIGAQIDFTEGDAEALPYADASFDVVLSQFGHMFAPRPEVAVAEMLRVLQPGGRIAFSTWPPELMTGRIFALTGEFLPPPPGVAPPPAWGDPAVVRQRLGEAVQGLRFHRDEMIVPTLSPQHYRVFFEQTAAPAIKVIQTYAGDPQKLADFRRRFEEIVADYFQGNRVRQSFLMSQAVKR